MANNLVEKAINNAKEAFQMEDDTESRLSILLNAARLVKEVAKSPELSTSDETATLSESISSDYSPQTAGNFSDSDGSPSTSDGGKDQRYDGTSGIHGEAESTESGREVGEDGEHPIQGSSWGRGGTDYRAETMGDAIITTEGSLDYNGGRNPRDGDKDETGKMDKDLNKGETDQIARSDEKVHGSGTVPNTESSRGDNDGRGLEDSSSSSTGLNAVLYAPTEDIEENLLKKNSTKYISINTGSKAQIPDLASSPISDPELEISTDTDTGEKMTDDYDNTETNPDKVLITEGKIVSRKPASIQRKVGSAQGKILVVKTRSGGSGPTLTAKLGAMSGVRQILGDRTTRTQIIKSSKGGHRREYIIGEVGSTTVVKSWCNPTCSRIRAIPKRERCTCKRCPRVCRLCREDSGNSGSDTD